MLTLEQYVADLVYGLRAAAIIALAQQEYPESTVNEIRQAIEKAQREA